MPVGSLQAGRQRREDVIGPFRVQLEGGSAEPGQGNVKNTKLDMAGS